MVNHNFDDYWAVTMFSFTNELLEARHTSLELIESVLADGLSKHIEIDGPMHFRNYPNPSTHDIAELKQLLSKHGAKISLIGGAADRAISSTRLVSSAEIVKSVKRQLELAADLGAFGLRLMVGGLSVDEVKAIAPTAEALDVKVLYELHGVMAADSEIARECLQLVKDVDSTHVRLMFDSSLFMTEMPKALLAALGRVGVGNTNEFDEKWQTSTLDEFRAWLMPQVEKFPPPFKAFIPTLTSRMGHSKPSDYDEYLPYIESVHLKYWEDGNTDADLINYLIANGYVGYLTSEWGGHEWANTATPALEMTRAHRDLIERSFNLAH
ncbi:MAG: sugar phosphate isomerase/epimerase family protein [Micrococcales bacterium]